MTSKRIALAFDTASDMLALCLGDVSGGQPQLIAAADAPAPRSSDQVLLTRAGELLAGAGLSPADIDLVIAGRGPGSFTGVRIGIATAKGIACGLGCPAFGVSTLDAVAWHAWRGGLRGRVGVVEDAMRKEVYPVRFVLDEGGVTRLDLDSVCKPAQVAQAWREAGEELTLIGDGLRKHAACFEEGPFTLGPEQLWTPDGLGLLQAFAAMEGAGELGSGDPAVLLPVYTRLSDAEEAERARLKIADSLPASGVADGRAVGGLFLHPLSVNDVDAAVELQRRAMPADAWTSGKLADEIGRTDRSWWVARKDGALVGCAGGQVVDGELCIFNVCVDPAQRRQGIAQRLLERVATDALALAAETVTLEVRTDNDPAIALYHTLGLADVGEAHHGVAGAVGPAFGVGLFNKAGGGVELHHDLIFPGLQHILHIELIGAVHILGGAHQLTVDGDGGQGVQSVAVEYHGVVLEQTGGDGEAAAVYKIMVHDFQRFVFVVPVERVGDLTGGEQVVIDGTGDGGIDPGEGTAGNVQGPGTAQGECFHRKLPPNTFS